jgi:hypothetical protein
MSLISLNTNPSIYSVQFDLILSEVMENDSNNSIFHSEPEKPKPWVEYCQQLAINCYGPKDLEIWWVTFVKGTREGAQESGEVKSLIKESGDEGSRRVSGIDDGGGII